MLYGLRSTRDGAPRLARGLQQGPQRLCHRSTVGLELEPLARRSSIQYTSYSHGLAAEARGEAISVALPASYRPYLKAATKNTIQRRAAGGSKWDLRSLRKQGFAVPHRNMPQVWSFRHLGRHVMPLSRLRNTTRDLKQVPGRRRTGRASAEPAAAGAPWPPSC